MLGNSSLWNDFRENFRTRGTKSLFMIPFYSDITEEDVERTDEIVKFYVGSYDNLTEDNQHRIIDIFTDSGLSSSINDILLRTPNQNPKSIIQKTIYCLH